MTVVLTVIYYLFDVLLTCFVIRAILSWVDPMGNWKITQFLTLITDPIIAPIRGLCEKKNLFQGLPLDIPYLIAVLILILIQTMVEILL